jgi:hypothetical protein
MPIITIIITAVLVLSAAAAVVRDWRLFLFAAVPVALLQDPIRKLVPGQPVIYVVLVGVIIAAAAVVATLCGTPPLPRNIRGWRRNLARPFSMFVALVALQGLHGMMTFGNPIIPAIGALSYLLPFVALGLVYQVVIRGGPTMLMNFLRFYVACVLPFLFTIALQFAGYDWGVLGEVGWGLRIYDQGTVMTAYSGLFRSSELAAWHAATCACFLIIFAMAGRPTVAKALWTAVLLLVVVGLGMVTGRRKFLIEIIVFASAYATFFLYFGRGMSMLTLISAAVGCIGFISFIQLMPDERGLSLLDSRDESYEHASYEAYLERSKTVFGAIPERVTDFGLAPVGWAYNEYGLFGAGLGAGAQGVAHFGAASASAAEGGLGKVFVELGAPGLVIVFWFGISLVRYIWLILNLIRQHSFLSRMAFGLASFLIANIAAFIVSTQVYSDLFVLLLIGFAIGALLAMPVLLERSLQQRMLSLTPKAAMAPSPHFA